MIWTGNEIARALLRYRGRRFLGVVRCGDAIEIVFENRRGHPPNLLSLVDDGRIEHGYVSSPDEYVSGWEQAA